MTDKRWVEFFTVVRADGVDDRVESPRADIDQHGNLCFWDNRYSSSPGLLASYHAGSWVSVVQGGEFVDAPSYEAAEPR